jgi:hypothetical protein
LAALAVPGLLAAAVPAPESLPELEVPESVFVRDLQNGADPFFPQSERMKPKVEEKEKPSEPEPPANPVDFLTLNGVAGRVAILNNKIIEAGDEVRITYTDSSQQSHQVTVRCLEVRDRSVLISVAGRPKTQELTLRDNP